ncbi:Phosphoribosylaminoimidazole carboxylase [Gymnopus androsaceus JB14]|uniref:Phosphoribosylaminoimidazole carboxylase n=1 Tax=Gymnopus androsaceus JB14 TaxID=1447944 RepID=A0A6A4GTB7_9AGAR|nr:Phosphoribosylaminoimidazole carboxylase [Gymnopus androsaceus JB14]
MSLAPTPKTIGILGGGQLGRMLAQSASLLNIPVVILDSDGPTTLGPAKQILNTSGHIDGSFRDAEKISELAKKVDVITVEIEHVDVGALEAAMAKGKGKVEVHPSPETIRLIQDKYLQKMHLKSVGCPVGDFRKIERWRYDGRGNYLLKSDSSVEAAIEALGGGNLQGGGLYAEKYVPFRAEIAVIVVRSLTGQVVSYPAVETVHKDNICHLVWAPYRISSIEQDPKVAERAERVAREAIEKGFGTGVGVFGVEMFLLDDDSILINEIAPRPHNSGHYTIEACESSQYDNHLRAILGLPLGSTAMRVPSAGMLNILGDSPPNLVTLALAIPGATPHLYGKSPARPGRKMGHITIVGESDAQVRERMAPLLSSDPLPAPPHLLGHSHPHPLISIIMGSDSDLPILLPAARTLQTYFPSIPFEVTLVSAHRTPLRLVKFAQTAKSRGIRCIIAGAGGAAHLPGMTASLTSVPVVGVPVDSKSVAGGGGGLAGVDAMYSILQMPRGIPVATVAINNSTNAALLAIRILSGGIPRLQGEMEAYLERLGEEVEGKVRRMGEGSYDGDGKLEKGVGGWEGYGK